MDTAKVYFDSEGAECSIWQMVKREPTWAAVRIQEGEKAIDEITTLRQQLEQAQARVAGIKQIIATEPELPGEMPEEMWQAFVDAINEGDREFVMTALRVAVKETKDCILERIREAERAGGEK